MTTVGYATIGIIPSFAGFRTALDRGTTASMATAGANAGRNFSGAFTKAAKIGALGGIGAAFGVGSFVKDSVELEAAYSKTMAQMRVATQAPADELQRLDDLAIELGKETVFSANETSAAMLEMAKNGIKPATIEAGGLESALTLAAAGSIELDDAAQVMGNTLNAFHLKGKRAAKVAAALAGAANASSASVGSLAEGLQQAASGAFDAGFNVEETTGILAAFANEGIAGSDAGTSLKTMLSRLVPQTAKAREAMKKYGLEFTKSNGEFKSAAQIAEELKNGLGDLSDEERAAALNTIFGSDARRAASILTRQGADGIRDYVKATSDAAAAEDMAKANMEGTSGAIERLKGSWETAKLEFGKEIAPVAADFLDYLADNIDDLAPKLVDFGAWFQDEGVPKIRDFANFIEDDVVPALEDIGGFAKDATGLVGDMVNAFNDLPKPAKLAGIAAILGVSGTSKLRGGGTGALGAAGKVLGLTKPVPVFVTNAKAIGGGAGGDLFGGGKGAGRIGAFGKAFGVAAGPSLAIAIGAWASHSANGEEDSNSLLPATFGFAGDGGMSLPSGFLDFSDANKSIEETSGKFDGLIDKADTFRDTLFLTGKTKVEPRFGTPGLREASRGLGEFIAQQVIAGKDVTPYIHLSGYERAMQQIKTLNEAVHAIPTAGTDNGVPFVSGAGTSSQRSSGASQRSTTINIGSVNTPDARRVMLDLESLERKRNGGGR